MIDIFDQNQKKIADQKLHHKQLKEQGSQNKTAISGIKKAKEAFDVIQLEKQDYEETKIRE